MSESQNGNSEDFCLEDDKVHLGDYRVQFGLRDGLHTESDVEDLPSRRVKMGFVRGRVQFEENVRF